MFIVRVCVRACVRACVHVCVCVCECVCILCFLFFFGEVGWREHILLPPLLYLSAPRWTYEVHNTCQGPFIQFSSTFALAVSRHLSGNVIVSAQHTVVNSCSLSRDWHVGVTHCHHGVTNKCFCSRHQIVNVAKLSPYTIYSLKHMWTSLPHLKKKKKERQEQYFIYIKQYSSMFQASHSNKIFILHILSINMVYQYHVKINILNRQIHTPYPNLETFHTDNNFHT